MRRVAVIGVGVTQFGRHERTSAELFAEAAADALADAEMPAGRVQALYYGNVVSGETEKQLHTGPQAASVLGIPTVPTTRFETACASSHAAFRHAVMEVASGTSDVVLVSEEVARKSRRPIWMLASAAASDSMLIGDKRDLSRVPATERAAATAYRQAGIGPQDVDVVELHDCFTIAEIVATEGLGLFEPGTGGIAAEKGWTSLGGKIPVNPSGGLKAKGHPISATGAAQICEAVTRLRGEAGPRQVTPTRRLTRSPPCACARACRSSAASSTSRSTRWPSACPFAFVPSSSRSVPPSVSARSSLI